MLTATMQRKDVDSHSGSCQIAPVSRGFSLLRCGRSFFSVLASSIEQVREENALSTAPASLSAGPHGKLSLMAEASSYLGQGCEKMERAPGCCLKE